MRMSKCWQNVGLFFRTTIPLSSTQQMLSICFCRVWGSSGRAYCRSTWSSCNTTSKSRCLPQKSIKTIILISHVYWGVLLTLSLAAGFCHSKAVCWDPLVRSVREIQAPGDYRMGMIFTCICKVLWKDVGQFALNYRNCLHFCPFFSG